MTAGGPMIGERAPYFRAMAAGSGREISPRTCAGRKLVLVFHDQGTAHVAEGLNRAVRELYPSPQEVVVASVVDLSLVPPLYWLTASTMIGQAYQHAAGRLPPGTKPSDYVVILQDWGGLISRRFGVRKDAGAVAVVVVDESAEISGFYQGRDPAGPVLDMLEYEG